MDQTGLQAYILEMHVFLNKFQLFEMITFIYRQREYLYFLTPHMPLSLVSLSIYALMRALMIGTRRIHTDL
jgi:hypothetical protein